MEHFDHRKIEKKWQKHWADKRAFSVPAKQHGAKQYVLDMFPYPSGDGLHVGHPEGYTATDIYSRYLRMNGKNVLHPMGWDAFGLPAENYAIKQGVHPAEVTAKNIANFKRQIQSLGFSYDWNREVNTTDPAYYKWTQWIFLQLFKRGLAYEKSAPIWWCPKDKTGLANEEVVDGKCDRCGTTVEKKMLKQWMLKITAYAERLISGLVDLDWPEGVKTLQRNWIGKSEGAEVKFEIPVASRLVFIHGKHGDLSKKSWYHWLFDEARQLGYKVDAPQLPNPHNPVFREWMDVLDDLQPNAETILVGHSRGCSAILRWIENQPVKKKVKKIILISGARGDKQGLAEGFYGTKYDYKKIKEHCNDFVVIHSKNDEVIPFADSEINADGLQAKIITLEQGHFDIEVKKIPELLSEIQSSVTVFTTRPDTLFGATYLVLSPEHELVKSITTKEQKTAVEKYVKSVAAKSDLERTSLEKEKTGVFTGAFAVNPVNNEKIPVWIADYVLSSYGTGAIMAVPAHDERDFAFATKFKLPIRQVVAPFYKNTTDLAVKEGAPVIRRPVAYGIIHRKQDDHYLCLRWKEHGWGSFVTGGIEPGEKPADAAEREIVEETGYKNVKHVSTIDWQVHTEFYATHKQENRYGIATGEIFELVNDEKVDIASDEQDRHELVWLPADRVRDFVTHGNAKYIWDCFRTPNAYVGEGVAVNSSIFDGLTSAEARQKIVSMLGEKKQAMPKVQFKLRDWVFSRQRYWGEPIPLVHCEKCGVVPVPESELPLKLPDVEKYEPTGTGESPLAGVDDWVNVKCRICGHDAKRETNTMPQWAGSCWYYLRFCDPHNDKEFASAEAMKAWLPVDMYVGGAEHAVLHLLYARFWHKVLFDAGYIPPEVGDEPFKKLKNQGLILGPDGEKMSKSRGNVINPDEIVEKYGADTLRMYEMFMGPFEDAKPWDTNGIVGVRRFLDKVWRIGQKVQAKSCPSDVRLLTHKTIKKVTEDIENFRFNTAVSSLMILANALDKFPDRPREEFESFLWLLKPFAPHIASEILDNLKRGNVDGWPSYDKKLIEDIDTVTFAIQVNGKLRGTLWLPAGSEQAHVEVAAKAETNVVKFLTSEPKKVIFVKDKLINFVV